MGVQFFSFLPLYYDLTPCYSFRKQRLRMSVWHNYYGIHRTHISRRYARSFDDETIDVPIVFDFGILVARIIKHFDMTHQLFKQDVSVRHIIDARSGFKSLRRVNVYLHSSDVHKLKCCTVSFVSLIKASLFAVLQFGL